MKMYNSVEETLNEWSRELMAKHGAWFRRYTTVYETLKCWSVRLTQIYGKPFKIYNNLNETIKEWSRLFWGGKNGKDRKNIGSTGSR